MPRSRTWGAVLALSLFPTLAAQNTHFVNGPDLQTAIDAAAPGDILIVDGVYGGIRLIIDKPLFLHGRPGAAIHMLFQNPVIDSIPAGTSLVLQGFTFSLRPPQVQNCAGMVLFADVRTAATVGYATTIDRCQQVAIDECTLGSGLATASSTVLITRSELLGTSAIPRLNIPPIPGLTAHGGRVVAVDSRFVGGEGFGLAPFDGAPGIALDEAALRLSGGGSHVAVGANATGPVEAVHGTGTVEHDARTTFVPGGGGVAIDPRIGVRLSRLPVTTINRTALGERATVRIDGMPGHAFALLGVAPILPVAIPGIEGELWTSPSALVQGLLDGTGVFALGFTVPDVAELRGVLFRWQGITTDGLALRFAEPATECHR